MFVALVTGSIVATQKTSTMTGHKLLVVEPYRLDEKKRSIVSKNFQRTQFREKFADS